MSSDYAIAKKEADVPQIWSSPRRRPRSFRPFIIIFTFLLAILYWSKRGSQSFGFPLTLPMATSDNSLSERQKARLQKVADLMLDIYQTLADMRYIDPAGIQRGPHHIQYDGEALDPSVAYLYNILPYVDYEEAGQSDFFHGGAFADFRDPEAVQYARDPFYADPEGSDFQAENGPYMQPWVTPLSQMGNHQSVILYDTRKHHIWIIDQENWASTDPALEGKSEAKPGTNRNSFQHIPSRPAVDVLRDIVRWYHTLEELPGTGGDNRGGEWEEDDIDLKSLYRKHGWPDNFDGDAFQVDQARADTAVYAKYLADEPLREVEKFTMWIDLSDRAIARDQNMITSAKTIDEEYLARFNEWDELRRRSRLVEDLKQAEIRANTLCPNGQCQRPEDLPLIELATLRGLRRYAQEHIRDVTLQIAAAEAGRGPPTPIHFPIDLKPYSLRHANSEFHIKDAAYNASRADAESLYHPDRIHDFISDWDAKTKREEEMQGRYPQLPFFISTSEKELQDVREWASQHQIEIPTGYDHDDEDAARAALAASTTAFPKTQERIVRDLRRLEQGLRTLRGKMDKLAEKEREKERARAEGLR